MTAYPIVVECSCNLQEGFVQMTRGVGAGFTRRIKKTVKAGLKRAYRRKGSTVSPDEHKAAKKLFEKGREEYNAGTYDLAVKQFRNAVEHEPGYAKAHYCLGNAYYKTERYKLAVRHWRRCAQLDSAGEFGARARQKLQYIEKKSGVFTDELVKYMDEVLAREERHRR